MSDHRHAPKLGIQRRRETYEPDAPVTQRQVVDRTRSTDRRLLIIFLFVVVGLSVAYGLAQHSQDQFQGAQRSLNHQQAVFERQVDINCNNSKAGHIRFNAVLEQLAANARASTALPAKEKAAALKTYAELHEPIPVCPPLPAGASPAASPGADASISY